MKRSGIKFQLRLLSFVPMLVVILFFTLFYVHEFNQEQQQTTAQLSEAYTQQLMPVAQWALLHHDNQTLQALIDASTINHLIQSLAFYDATGHVLAYRGDKPSPLTSFKQQTFRDPKHPYSMYFITPIRITTFHVYAPHLLAQTSASMHADHVLGWLSIRLDTASISIKYYKIALSIVGLVLLACLIGFFTYHVLARKISYPIYRLRRSMTHVLNGAFETPIQTTSTGEFGVIEAGCAHLQATYLSTLQDMHQHIETATHDLQQSHELLEEKNIQLLLDKRKADEKHQQKSMLINNMSHEIRTPMNGIIGFANLLLESQLGPLEQDYAKTIKVSAQNLLNIINDILDYSKIDACKLQLDAIPLDIRACIDDVFALSTPNAHRKGLELIPSTAIDVPRTVLGDPLRLKQIISNLVDNAVKFTENGYVLVRTTIEQETEKDYTFCLSVIDTGIGMTFEEQSTLFHPFHQADTSISRRYGGSGLGLVICKQLTEQMGGRLVLTSEPSKGTTFSAYIKLEKLHAYEIEKTQTHRFAHLNILCFDDNPLYLEALCNGLGVWGIHCIRVTAFNQLEQALAEHPECQLAFINVNQGEEEHTALLLQKQSIPCILMSKWFIPNYAALGAAGFLLKPPNIQKLQETISSLASSLETRFQSLPLITPNPPALELLRKKLRDANPHVLVADDSAVNRMLFYSWLNNNACIDLVEDGQQTVALCHKKRFDAILLDLHMPNLDGMMAARLIREQTTLNQHTPILLISANHQDIHRANLKENGIDHYLTKPIDEQLLLEHLLAVITPTQQPAIDWALCVQKMSGNEAHARNFLVHFIDDLQQNKTQLWQSMQTQNHMEIERIAHKIHGSCCFFGVPTLQHLVAKLEYAAKHMDDLAQLHAIFTACMEHIEIVLNEAVNINASS